MSREPLFMKVDIEGDVVRRQAEPIHLYDQAGRAVATCMRPILRADEMLVERLGTFPKIVKVPA